MNWSRTANSAGSKAWAVTICVGIAAAAGKIRTSLMLVLVFIETAIIYALIVAILMEADYYALYKDSRRK